ncbi:hypothetical protein C1Y63_02615 [Corynebacterium sp. 13CS0277]|uniref:hypothetical protein n=1 Tax=Corynebacterium sp. 13CS0277 TaxID=2071994 RepID=UPI000D0441E1|nr:hypothetical protein [Corynebacterium sp. 13CS0277]PRQ12221.1 hypothetical protein C1Y63_02615 [Corynebacterium sp. 13CS0277]
MKKTRTRQPRFTWTALILGWIAICLSVPFADYVLLNGRPFAWEHMFYAFVPLGGYTGLMIYWRRQDQQRDSHQGE